MVEEVQEESIFVEHSAGVVEAEKGDFPEGVREEEEKGKAAGVRAKDEEECGGQR